MTDKIAPALSPEEWASFAERVELTQVQLGWACSEVTSARTNVDRHGLAAIALHGQPFGFTRDDLDLIRSRFDLSDDVWRTEAEAKAASLYARIAALLPPEPR